MEEKIDPAINFAMRCMYQSKVGAGLRSMSYATKMLQKTSEAHGREFDSPESHKKIESFIETFSLDVNEILLPLEEYKTFNEFFYRKLKPEARPILDLDNPKIAVSPADCRLVVFDNFDKAKEVRRYHFIFDLVVFTFHKY